MPEIEMGEPHPAAHLEDPLPGADVPVDEPQGRARVDGHELQNHRCAPAFVGVDSAIARNCSEPAADLGVGQ
jgi:hypothetical protein